MLLLHLLLPLCVLLLALLVGLLPLLLNLLLPLQVLLLSLLLVIELLLLLLLIQLLALLLVVHLLLLTLLVELLPLLQILPALLQVGVALLQQLVTILPALQLLLLALPIECLPLPIEAGARLHVCRVAIHETLPVTRVAGLATVEAFRCLDAAVGLQRARGCQHLRPPAIAVEELLPVRGRLLPQLDLRGSGPPRRAGRRRFDPEHADGPAGGDQRQVQAVGRGRRGSTCGPRPSASRRCARCARSSPSTGARRSDRSCGTARRPESSAK